MILVIIIIEKKTMICDEKKAVSDKEGRSIQDSVILEELVQCLKNIAYGEIVVTIHDSRIVQIERREKKRFPPEKYSDCTGRA